MKKIITAIGVVALIGAIAYPAFAHGPGWGQGGYMMRSWGGDSDNCAYYGGSDTRLTEDQRSSLDNLYRKYNDETAQIRQELWSKQNELRTIFNTSNPDAEKAKSVQEDINNLRAKLSQKQIDFQIEKRKITPDERLGSGYGRGYGPHMRGGGNMMGYGRGGGHMMGYGSGAW